MYELDKAAFGRFLAQLRREKGMTQKELAATLYVSDKAVSKWERGLSVPDISLLVPLAEQLNVTVAELLQGRRVEEEQRFTREETEDLIRKALTFSAEPPERRQARTKKYLPVYVICCVLGVAEALAVWAAGLADIEGCSSSVWFSASSTGHMPCSGWPRPCPATTTRTASATLHRVRSTSTSRASITTTATGSTSCGRSGSGRWCRWCWCRPARRGLSCSSALPAGRCGARCWWCISPRCSGLS
jgi:transcriptional regulator with XRE-family HTH domain